MSRWKVVKLPASGRIPRLNGILTDRLIALSAIKYSRVFALRKRRVVTLNQIQPISLVCI